MSSPVDLDSVRDDLDDWDERVRRCLAAGPWMATSDPDGRDAMSITSGGRVVARIPVGPIHGGLIDLGIDPETSRGRIATARSLLAEVERLRAEVAALRAHMAAYPRVDQFEERS